MERPNGTHGEGANLCLKQRTTWSDETLIKANTNVLAVTQSAMFDPKAFEDPDTFKGGRNWYHYFTFGYGAHECLGKYVGMVMIPEMVRQILLVPNISAKGDIQYGGHMPKSYELTWS